MIETIIQFNGNCYPFDTLGQDVNLKLETLIDCEDVDVFNQQKKKYQTFKNFGCVLCVRLGQIYQEGLKIHLIYQPVRMSLMEFFRNQLEKCQESNLPKLKKQLLKTTAVELANLTDFLSNSKIITRLRLSNMGINAEHSPKPKNKIKYFVGSQFQFTQHPKQKLVEFYLAERRRILGELEVELGMERKSDYLPNFIIRGNKLVFTDQLSETKTKKKGNGDQQDRFDPSTDNQLNKNDIKQDRKGKSSAKPKKQHKYSCNFQQQNLKFDFQKQKLNKSFEEDSTYSITKTRSMKIQMQHQKPTKKNRKNSLKFKITTFEQISIDQSIDQDNPFQQFQSHHRESYAPNQQNPEPDYNGDRNGDDKKDYRQKVNEAKIKAQALLSKYIKAKNRSAYK